MKMEEPIPLVTTPAVLPFPVAGPRHPRVLSIYILGLSIDLVGFKLWHHFSPCSCSLSIPIACQNRLSQKMALNAADLGAPIQVFQPLLGRCLQAANRALSEARTVLGPPRLPLRLPIMSSQHIQPFLELESITVTEALHGSYAVFNLATVLFLSL